MFGLEKVDRLNPIRTSSIQSRELYHLQFSLQAASPETFGYTLLGRKSVFSDASETDI